MWMAENGYYVPSRWIGGDYYHDTAAEALKNRLPGNNETNITYYDGARSVGQVDVLIKNPEFDLWRGIVGSPFYVSRSEIDVTANKGSARVANKQRDRADRIREINRTMEWNGVEALKPASKGIFEKENLLVQADDGTYLVVNMPADGIAVYTPLDRNREDQSKPTWWQKPLVWFVENFSIVQFGDSPATRCSDTITSSCVY